MHFFSIINIYRLDQILGKQGSKAKDVYASKISLASRVVKVERSVSSTKIKNKLNILRQNQKLNG